MPLDLAKLKEQFTASGLTLEEAGTRMGWDRGIARQSFHKLLAGTAASPRLETIERLCGVFGCGITALLTDDSPANGPRKR